MRKILRQRFRVFEQCVPSVLDVERQKHLASDPHLAMFIYRAMPLRPGQLSPAELLNQHKCRALPPIHQYLHPNWGQRLLQSESQAASRSTAIPERLCSVGSKETILAESHSDSKIR